jgi:hypothetical protein
MHINLEDLRTSKNPKDVRLYEELTGGKASEPDAKVRAEKEEPVVKQLGEEGMDRILNRIKDPSIKYRLRQFMRDTANRYKYCCW